MAHDMKRRRGRRERERESVWVRREKIKAALCLL